MGRPAAKPRRRWASPPRPRPREAGSSDIPAPSPVAEQQAWLEARFAREASDAPPLSPLVRAAVAISGGALAGAMLLAGAVRALAWFGA